MRKRRGDLIRRQDADAVRSGDTDGTSGMFRHVGDRVVWLFHAFGSRPHASEASVVMILQDDAPRLQMARNGWLGSDLRRAAIDEQFDAGIEAARGRHQREGADPAIRRRTTIAAEPESDLPWPRMPKSTGTPVQLSAAEKSVEMLIARHARNSVSRASSARSARA